MVWEGNAEFRFAPALATLFAQLQQAYPDASWQTSPETGTIGDAAHQAENSASDHNPWLDNTVRALDIAADVQGVPGIVDVSGAPDCEALFAMVNRMYAGQDPRVWPNGYAIYKGRITDWDNPGGVHAQQGDPHLYHLHISVSQNPAGFNSTAPWPLPSSTSEAADSSTAHPITVEAAPMPGQYEILRNKKTGAVRAAGPDFWRPLEGKTVQQTETNIANAMSSPLCIKQADGTKSRDVSDPGMTWWKNFYLNLKG